MAPFEGNITRGCRDEEAARKEMLSFADEASRKFPREIGTPFRATMKRDIAACRSLAALRDLDEIVTAKLLAGRRAEEWLMHMPPAVADLRLVPPEEEEG